MAAKKQFVIQTELDTLNRLDALRIVMGQPRARVAEAALLGGGLKGLEKTYAARLERLKGLAGESDWAEYVNSYAARYARMTYGPSLEDLETNPDLMAITDGEPEPVTV